MGENTEELKTELRKKIWGTVLLLTVEMQYAKRFEKAKLQGKYEAYKEMWEHLGGDIEQK